MFKKMLERVKSWTRDANSPSVVEQSVIKPCPFCNALAWDFGNYYYVRHFDNCFLASEYSLHEFNIKGSKKLDAYNKRAL